MNSQPPKPGSRLTLGPLADLEPHLPAEWWRDLFSSLYLKTDGDVVEHEASTASEVDAIVAACNLASDAAILDLCCGQGRHTIELARRGFTSLTGIDRSRYLVRLARRRAKKENFSITFKEGDARDIRLPKASQDLVCMMGNSFGYFDREEDDLAVLQAVIRVLKPGGRLLLDITDGDWMRDHFEPRSWEWIDQNQFVCRERSISADGKKLISREVVTHAERGVIADQLYAERLYSKSSLAALLQSAGLENITFKTAMDGQSARDPGMGQDLGMMAHRFFIACDAPVMPRPLKLVDNRPLTVCVVMGDPSLPDTVKVNGKFNAEDFETIARLKEALGELGGYQFTYLDRHESLIDDLRNVKPDLILNLCDEGFLNDAFKELHLPALFEMFALPYSGAGPACLGICYDKALVRSFAMAHNIPVPLETYVRAGDRMATLPSVFPALLKPATGDSSIGITRHAVVDDSESLIAYLNHLHDVLPGRAVLVQEFLSGQEYTVALIGNPATGLQALPVLEVDYSGLDEGLPKILGYESKWNPDSPYWNQVRYIETSLHPEMQREMIEHCAQLFEILDCRDYARFDFRADGDGVIKLLEVNPNPGWCWDGKLMLMASLAGMTYAELLEQILITAVSRYEGLERTLDAIDKDDRLLPRPLLLG